MTPNITTPSYSPTNGALSPPPTDSEFPNPVFEEKPPSSPPDIGSNMQLQQANGMNGDIQRQTSPLKISYELEYNRIFKENYELLKENAGLLKETSKLQNEKHEMEKINWQMKESMRKIEEDHESKHVQWQEEIGKSDAMMKSLEEDPRRCFHCQVAEESKHRADGTLEVNTILGFHKKDGDFSWRMCKLDTGSPRHNLIASSALEVLTGKRRDYKGASIVGVGGSPDGIMPKEEIELDWHVRGKKETYTSWFVVWEEEHKGTQVPLGVDVLLGNVTIAENKFFLRNYHVYLINSPDTQPDNSLSIGHASTDTLHGNGRTTSFSLLDARLTGSGE